MNSFVPGETILGTCGMEVEQMKGVLNFCPFSLTASVLWGTVWLALLGARVQAYSYEDKCVQLPMRSWTGLCDWEQQICEWGSVRSDKLMPELSLRAFFKKTIDLQGKIRSTCSPQVAFSLERVNSRMKPNSHWQSDQNSSRFQGIRLFTVAII